MTSLICLFLALAVPIATVLTGIRWFRLGRRTDIAGRWVAITGCDSGFGRGVVEALVARKARVIACCYTPEGAEAALAAGAELAPWVDLADEMAVDALATQIDEACDGTLWGLVHNAGVVLPGMVDYLPLAVYRRVMEVNFFAPVGLTRPLLAALRKGRGRVVVVSSVDGLVSLPGNAPYDASKFAVEAFADALRVELSYWGVGVSVVNPSTMRTPLAMGFFEGHRKAWSEMERADPDGPWRTAWPQDWLDRYVPFNTEQLHRIAQSPDHAIGDLVHALTAVRPHHRYLSGTLAKTLFYGLWSAPEGWAYRLKRTLIQPLPPGVDPSPNGALRWAGLALLALVVAGGAWSFSGSDGPHTTGMLHVNINVSDFDRSVAFYEGIGFQQLMDVEPHGSAEVAAAVGLEPYVLRGALMAHQDGSMLDLLEWQDPSDPAPPYERLNHLGIARIALTTSDLDADVARLRADGVVFLSEVPASVPDVFGGATRFICFRDPDGTVVELVELGTVMGWLRQVGSWLG